MEDGQLRVIVNNEEKVLQLRTAAAWDVAEPRQIEVSSGDKILVRANAKGLGLVNGDILQVQRISADGTLHCSDGKQMPPTFKQWCHGYVITSHQAQDKTANHVVVAASMMNQKTTYVACSRGRQQCRVHTPNKQRLLDRLPVGDRKAALDVLAQQAKVGFPERIMARVLAWAKLAAAPLTSSLLPKPSRKLSAQLEATIQRNITASQLPTTRNLTRNLNYAYPTLITRTG